MQITNRIKNSRLIFFLEIFAFITLLFWSKDVLNSIFVRFPLIDNSRDWLGIISDVVQSFGLITLIYFFIDINERNKEERTKRTPKILINVSGIVNNAPDGETRALCETSKEDLLNQISLLSSLPSRFEEYKKDDYIELWEKLQNSSKDSDQYLRIELTNIQGNAKRFRVVLTIEYKDAKETTPENKIKLICPPGGIVINGNDDKRLFVKIGKLRQPEKEFEILNVSVVDYVCENIEGDIIIGTENDYSPILAKEYDIH